MDRKWVLNASPVIVLSAASLVWVFPELASEIVIPEAVVHEIHQGPSADPARLWLMEAGKAHVRDIGSVEPQVAGWNLGNGESEVISWAYSHPSYEAIIDDRAARRCAAPLGVRVRGTVGVLLLAKKHGLIPALGPALGQVKDAGLRVNEALVAKALRLAGEE